MGIPVKLEVFEGPLDLLLHLIEKNKIDIYDIPIVEITDPVSYTHLDVYKRQVMDKVVEVKGVKLLAAKVDGVDMNGLRDLGDQLKGKLGEGVVLLAAVNGEKDVYKRQGIMRLQLQKMENQIWDQSQKKRKKCLL